KARRSTLEREYAEAQAHEAELEQQGAALVPALAQSQETWYRLSSLKERFGGSSQLAAERARNASRTQPEERAGRGPEELRAEAELKSEVEGLDGDGGGLDAEVEEAAQALSEAEEKLVELRAAEREAQKEHAAFGARKKALELGLNRKDGAGALLAATDRLS